MCFEFNDVSQVIKTERSKKGNACIQPTSATSRAGTCVVTCCPTSDTTTQTLSAAGRKTSRDVDHLTAAAIQKPQAAKNPLPCWTLVCERRKGQAGLGHLLRVASQLASWLVGNMPVLSAETWHAACVISWLCSNCNKSMRRTHALTGFHGRPKNNSYKITLGKNIVATYTAIWELLRQRNFSL